MAGHIYPKVINNHTYYYYQRTWREKVDPKGRGKNKGSGKSRVRTQSIYLGTAEDILERKKNTRSPLEVKHREFGFVGAIYQTAAKIGLVELLQKHIPGQRYGLPRWLYFLLAIINRLQKPASKEQMGKWADSTVLPDLLSFNPKKLNSKSYWYAIDDVISEKELRKNRKKQPGPDDDLFVGLDDSTFRSIESALFDNLQERFGLSSNILFYDTTNFFTYIEEPVRSHLARTGHNKDCHHHLKQVGLALCVEKEWGVPLFHRLYRGNSHDSMTFAGVIDDLLDCLKSGFDNVDKLVLVLDKGNNSKDNFKALAGKIQWVGSLVPSQFPDLMDLPLSAYEGATKQHRYYRRHRKVMGVDCVLILTYSAKLARKQEHSLSNGIEKLKRQVSRKWAEYKRRPKKVPAGVKRLLKESRYGKYLRVRCRKGEPMFEETEAVEKRRKRFGKTLLFSSDESAEASWVIEQYHAKDLVEDGFKLLKDPGLISFRPIRHWTDTKIFAFGFCCVMALVLIRVMQLMADRAGLTMSGHVLKEELVDLQEVIMIYDDKSAEMLISSRSSVQQRLWDLFDLGTLERHLTIH